MNVVKIITNHCHVYWICFENQFTHFHMIIKSIEEKITIKIFIWIFYYCSHSWFDDQILSVRLVLCSLKKNVFIEDATWSNGLKKNSKKSVIVSINNAYHWSCFAPKYIELEYEIKSEYRSFGAFLWTMMVVIFTSTCLHLIRISSIKSEWIDVSFHSFVNVWSLFNTYTHTILFYKMFDASGVNNANIPTTKKKTEANNWRVWSNDAIFSVNAGDHSDWYPIRMVCNAEDFNKRKKTYNSK